MRIALAAIEFDILGYVEIDLGARFEGDDYTRRASVDPVLDESVVLSDGGYADGDSPFNYSWISESQEHNALIARLVQNYSLVKVHNNRGTFSCAFINFRDRPDVSSIQLRPIEKLSA